MMDLAKSSLIQKAMKRPDQVRRIIQKVKAEGLMSTWEQVNAKLDAPVPLGYSACGEVVEAGVAAAVFRPGQRVACAGVGYAAHAELIAVPGTLTVPVPDAVTDDEAAFGTLGAIAMQAVRQAQPQVGELFGVIGLGLLGNLVTQILTAGGVRVVGSDLDPRKIELAKSCGAELAGTDMKAMADQISAARGLDGIIIAAGSRDSGIIQSCPPCLRHRGRIVVLGFVGMDCPHQEFYNKELELRMSMSYGPGRYDPTYEEKAHDYPYPFVRWTEQRNIESFLHLVAQGKVDVKRLITHRFDFDQALAAYQLLESKEWYLGIVLQYSGRVNLDERITSVNPVRQPNPRIKGKLALIGSGGFASGVLGPILKKLEVPVRSVTAQRGSSAVTGAKGLGAEIATTDFQAAITDNEVSHVLIATRHAAHAAQTEAALRAGKRVHVEKPLCVNRTELEHLRRIVEELGATQRLQVGFNRRYSPLSLQLVEAVRRQPGIPLTVVYRINAGVLEDGHWFFDDPGGRLTAEGCHFIDYCRMLVGRPVTRIQAIQQGRSGRPFDSFIITAAYRDGAQATIIYSGQGDRTLRKERIEVFQGRQCWVLDDWSSLVAYAEGKERKVYSGRQAKGWGEEMEHFLGLKDHSLAPSWEETVEVHEAMFDAIDAALGVEENEQSSVGERSA